MAPVASQEKKITVWSEKGHMKREEHALSRISACLLTPRSLMPRLVLVAPRSQC